MLKPTDVCPADSDDRRLQAALEVVFDAAITAADHRVAWPAVVDLDDQFERIAGHLVELYADAGWEIEAVPGKAEASIRILIDRPKQQR